MWVDLMCGECEFEVDVGLWHVGVRDFFEWRESRRVELRDWARGVEASSKTCECESQADF